MSKRKYKVKNIVLKPCPFCGDPATSIPWHGGAPTTAMIECTSDLCEVSPSVTGETFAEAAMFWNRRVKS